MPTYRFIKRFTAMAMVLALLAGTSGYSLMSHRCDACGTHDLILLAPLQPAPALIDCNHEVLQSSCCETDSHCSLPADNCGEECCIYEFRLITVEPWKEGATQLIGLNQPAPTETTAGSRLSSAPTATKVFYHNAGRPPGLPPLTTLYCSLLL